MGGFLGGPPRCPLNRSLPHPLSGVPVPLRESLPYAGEDAGPVKVSERKEGVEERELLKRSL